METTPNSTAGNETCYLPIFNTYAELGEYARLAQWYMFIPSALIIVALCLLTRRKEKWLYWWDGRPGVAAPIDYLSEHSSNRWLIVATFCLALTFLIQMIFYTSSGPPGADDKANATNRTDYELLSRKPLIPLIMLYQALLEGLRIFPLVAAITNQTPLGYALGAVYAWILGPFVLLPDLFFCWYPTSKYPDMVEADIDQIVVRVMAMWPSFVSWCLLAFGLPYKCVTRLWAGERSIHKAFERAHVDLPEHHITHVQMLFKGELARLNKPQSAVEKLTRFVKPVAGFRLPITMLIAVCTSIVLCYYFFILILYIYYMVTREMALGWDYIINHFNRTRLSNPEQDVQPGDVSLNVLEYTMLSLTRDTGVVATGILLIRILGVIALFGAFAMTVVSLLSSLRRFRYQLVHLYAGHLKALPSFGRKWSPANVVQYSLKFIGLQVSFAAWGFIIQSLVCLVVVDVVVLALYGVIVAKNWRVFYDALYFFISLVVSMLVLTYIPRFIVHFAFLQQHEDGRRVLSLNNRRLFYAFEFLISFCYMPLGLSLVLYFDCFVAYVCMLAVENQHTNPVMVVSCHLLQQTVRDTPFSFRVNPRWRRRITLRNKWHLFVTLSNNIELLKYRWQPHTVTRLIPMSSVYAGLFTSTLPENKDGLEQKHIVKF